MIARLSLFLLIAAVHCSALRINSLLKKSYPVILGFGISWNTPSHLDISNYVVPIVHADSTGKFSSKMTAKKRYLPRVIAGVAEFNKAIASDTSIDAFVDSGDLAGMTRAMDLYGASLRKGEIPDEISRTSTKLSTAYADLMTKLKKTKSEQSKVEARAALDAYLKFAKLSSSQSSTPAEPLKEVK